ncbi:Pectate disaccharide-lyase precursor [Raoultella ornithinolytica]|nr:Pectate disaccharide-lyase precursor [Raoultella ornithinolytica]
MGKGSRFAHEIRNSIAIGNHLDGFTDNFNPGKLVVVNNVAVDNQRFNYLFRPSPYGKPETQGNFSDNLSLRSQPGNMMMPLSGILKITTTLFAGEKASMQRGKPF